MSVKFENNNIQQFCRICYEIKSDLVSSFTKLIYGNVTCSINEILKLLIKEEDEPNYPVGVCPDCKELVKATFVLSVKYTKTTQLLKDTASCVKTEESKQILPSAEAYERSDVESTDGENDFKDGIEIHNDDIKKEVDCITAVPYPHEKVPLPSENVPLPLENVPLPCENVPLPRENVLLPREKVPLPRKNVPLPHENVPLPRKNVPFPRKNVSLPRKNVPLLPKIVPLPREIFLLPRKIVPLPREIFLLSRENVPLPRENVPLPSENVPLPRGNAPLARENVPLPRENVPLPREKVQLPRENVPLPRGNVPLARENVPLPRENVPLPREKVQLPRENVPHPLENDSQNPTGAFSCPICPEKLESAISLRAHAQTHTTLQKYFKGKPVPKNAVFVAKPYEKTSIFKKSQFFHPCVTCKKKLSIDMFRIHMKMHRDQENFVCKKCGRSFRKESYLNIHKVRAHLDEYPFKCDKCKKGFVIKRNCEYHLLTHTQKELPHKCEFCSKKFANPNHLHRHLFIHTENVSYALKYKVHRCNSCKRSFKSDEDLFQHRKHCSYRAAASKRVRKGGPGAYQCPICPKSYHSIEGLDIHSRTKHHDPENSKVLCSVCGKSFANIFVHMASHNEQKPYKCDLCPKTFTMKTVLKQHLLVHSGKKPYICSSCGRAFNNLYNLQVHERIHKGDKCHKCSVCGKGFLEKSYLSKHMRVHKGEVKKGIKEEVSKL